MRSPLSFAGLVAVACAAASPPDAIAPDSRSLDAALATWSADSAGPAVTRRVAPVVSPTTIREPPPRVASRPPGTRRHVDVHFAGAELEQALSLLAAAGRFSLVADTLPSAEVTLTLHDVDPYDALLAICVAHGVSVRTRGRLVVVSAAP